VIKRMKMIYDLHNFTHFFVSCNKIMVDDVNDAFRMSLFKSVAMNRLRSWRVHFVFLSAV
jgi:hypothetical protein